MDRWFRTRSPRGSWPGFATGIVVAALAVGAAGGDGRVAASAPAGLDWEAVGPILSPHDGWGLRAIVGEAGGDPGTPSERWAPVAPRGPVAAVTPSPDAEDPGLSENVALPTGGQPVYAIGVTSPSAQAVLDVRIWRLVDRSPVRVEPVDLPGAMPGVDRLLVPPASLALDGAWPAGTYQLDLLVGHRVLSVFAVLPAAPRDPASFARIVGLAEPLPPGPFSVLSGGETGDPLVAPLDVAAADPMTAGVMWLQPRNPSDGRAPLVATIDGNAGVIALGIRGAPGEHIVSAVLFNQSPPIIPIRTTAALTTQSDGSEIAVFDPGRGGVKPGVYRIDSSWVIDGAFVPRTWALDVRAAGARPDAVPPLLAAARAWGGYGGAWSIVAEGVAADPQEPGVASVSVEELGPDCTGGSVVPAGDRIIGVGYAGPRARGVDVVLLDGSAAGVPLDAAVSIDPVPGLVLLAPRAAVAWEPGDYAITVHHGDAADRLVVCVVAAP